MPYSRPTCHERVSVARTRPGTPPHGQPPRLVPRLTAGEALQHLRRATGSDGPRSVRRLGSDLSRTDRPATRAGPPHTALHIGQPRGLETPRRREEPRDPRDCDPCASRSRPRTSLPPPPEAPHPRPPVPARDTTPPVLTWQTATKPTAQHHGL